MNKSDYAMLLFTAIVVITAFIWLKTNQNEFDDDMYIIQRDCSAISDEEITELYAGECVEVALKKTSNGYKVRRMEEKSEYYIQNIDLLRKATHIDSITYRNEKVLREAIRKAAKASRNQ